MIYFDNAATTLIKPLSVKNAMLSAMDQCASPGRGGHKPAMQAARVVFNARETVADFFGMTAPENVVFTLNATHALNIAIKSVMHGGGHVVISGYEHNSVVRPLESMADSGVSYTVAQSKLFDADDMLQSVQNAVTCDTKCVIINHVSNVFGSIAPIHEIDNFCLERGISMIVDASQSAGILPINVQDFTSVAFFCMPGHKSLYGPQGSGILLCCSCNELYSIIQGGTGSNSIETSQPSFLPDIFESGTMNVPAIAGLAAGIRHVEKTGVGGIANHSRRLIQKFASNMPDSASLFLGGNAQAGLVSFRCNVGSEEMASMLGDANICVRAGLHCSPLAHESAGTLPDGTVRVSFSCFTTQEEVFRASSIIGKIIKQNV